MNFKTTLFLILILAAVGGYVAWDRVRSAEKGDKTESKAPADAGRLFADIPEADVTSVVIRPADADEIVLNRVGNRWRMVKPIDAPADIGELVPTLLGLRSTRQVELADTGLDKPSFRIDIAAAGGKLLRFSVGKKLPLDNAMYVQVAGKAKADVVAGDAYDLLSVPANDLQTKKLIDVDANKVQRLTIAAAGKPRIALERTGSGWVTTEPRRMPVDGTAIHGLLEEVLGLTATDFVSLSQVQAMKSPPFATPKLTIWFGTDGAAMPASAPTTAATTAATNATTTASATTQPAGVTIVFGDYDTVQKAKVFATVTGVRTAVKVEASTLDRFAGQTAGALWDKKVLDLDPAQVSMVSISGEHVPNAPPPGTREIRLERRKAADQAGATTAPTAAPATGPAAVTRPKAVVTTGPTTAAVVATGPASRTVAAGPASAWVLKSSPAGDAEDADVTALLGTLHPLTAEKYIETTAAASTKPSARYTLRITTVAPGGTPVTNYEVKFSGGGGDGAGAGGGGDGPVVAEYNGLRFEPPWGFMTKLEGTFAKKPKIETGGSTGSKPGADFKLPGEK